MEYNKEMTLDDTLLHSYSVLPRHHQRCLLLPAVDGNKYRNPQVENVQREWEALNCKVLNVIFLSNPSPWSSGNSVEEKAERLWEPVATEDTQRNSAFYTQQDLCTYKLTVSVAACTGPAQSWDQWGPSHDGESTQAPIPNPEAISNWQQVWIENFVFSSGISLGIQAILKDRHQSLPVVDGQHKTNSTVISEDSVS